MPVHRGRDTNGCFYQYGNLKKYYYTCGDAKSRMESKKKAIKQMVAISYVNPEYVEMERKSSRKASNKSTRKASNKSTRSPRKVKSTRKTSRKGSSKSTRKASNKSPRKSTRKYSRK